jgi:hypothetical protein
VQILSTLIIGMLFGWGIGAAAMRAALAARDPALLQKQMKAVIARYEASLSLFRGSMQLSF